MGEKSGSGSGMMNNPDHISDSESLETNFRVKILEFFDADPGWIKFGSGIQDPNNILDTQHCKKATYFWISLGCGGGLLRLRER
jgi:hypothetical protein